MPTQSLIVAIRSWRLVRAAQAFTLASLLALAGCASTPNLASQQTQALSNMGFKKVDDGWKLVLPDRVSFEFDNDGLKPELEKSIADVARQLLSVQIMQVRVEGHSDNVGPRDYNRDLSLRRANTVAAVLIAAGFSAHDVESKGYGMDLPIADNATDVGRMENRRVEIIALTDALSPPAMQ